MTKGKQMSGRVAQQSGGHREHWGPWARNGADRLCRETWGWGKRASCEGKVTEEH